MAASFPVLFLAFGPTVAGAAAAAFLAQGQAKVGGADGALREDHLVYGQIARGQPYDAKCLHKALGARKLVPLLCASSLGFWIWLFWQCWSR